MKDIVKIIQELKGEFGKGKKSTFSKGESDVSRSKDKTHSEKSRVVIYKSIDDALHKGAFGQIFSTVNSDRLYVITHSKWGKSGQQTVGGKTAKGFTKGSIPSSFGDIKSYAIRTLQRHGGKKDKQLSKRADDLKGK